jgi:hypothetical protein
VRTYTCASLRACESVCVCECVCECVSVCVVHVCESVRRVCVDTLAVAHSSARVSLCMCVSMCVRTCMCLYASACVWLPALLECVYVSCVCMSRGGRGRGSSDWVGGGQGWQGETEDFCSLFDHPKQPRSLKKYIYTRTTAEDKKRHSPGMKPNRYG